MSATYNAEQSKGQIERALIQIQRLAVVFQHVQTCAECQRIVKVGLSSRAALNGYLLWHAGIAEGNSHEQREP